MKIRQSRAPKGEGMDDPTANNRTPDLEQVADASRREHRSKPPNTDQKAKETLERTFRAPRRGNSQESRHVAVTGMIGEFLQS